MRDHAFQTIRLLVLKMPKEYTGRMTEEEFIDSIYKASKDQDDLVERLEAALRERLRVNVGLLKENSDLRKTLDGQSMTIKATDRLHQADATPCDDSSCPKDHFFPTKEQRKRLDLGLHTLGPTK